ncbi:MAG TPA: heterodisulfide reductase-related iron-sulfur binding cluster [Casimicrobiaceae bacterium]|nr:heterodisulfide reductase-related iron-sulfur binding cluster [Casimicrobiaceae bacterium]
MTTREGSLEAPTRHPLDWKSPSFFDKEALDKELERIFDICHGCRRCVSLCQAFPTLFDLVDASKTGEVDGVAKSDYQKVIDQCYLCDLCYMTKCPYVPPHPWNVDFPHLMLRGKAYKFKTDGAGFRDRLLTGTDRMGKLASIPVVAKTVNWANRTPSMRKALEKTLGVAKGAALPTYTTAPVRSSPPRSMSWPVRDGQRTPGKVAVFTTCYVNYNEPGLARDLAQILEHNRVPFVFATAEVCCGMPKLELGDLESVEKLKARNMPVLAPLAHAGYAILTPVPSCTLMFKQELPLMFPDDEDVKAVRDAMFDPFEYLFLRDKDGLLRRDFKRPLGKISYHVPCHTRVQNVGQKTREVLAWAPETEVSTVERCAGHDGTYGVKRESYEASMKIGRPVFKRMAEPDPDYISSDCPIAGRRIEQGMSEGDTQRARKAHPLTLIRFAYGLEMTDR